MVQSHRSKTARSIQLDNDETGTHSRSGHHNGDPLTKIHKEILRSLAEGCTKQQAAHTLRMSVHTLDGHLRDIYEIMDAHTMTAAVAKAIRENMI